MAWPRNDYCFAHSVCREVRDILNRLNRKNSVTKAFFNGKRLFLRNYPQKAFVQLTMSFLLKLAIQKFLVDQFIKSSIACELPKFKLNRH